MENEEKFSVDTENLKNETKDTVNKVKETIKNVDFKKDTEETKGFLKDMIADPVATVKRVATGEENVFKKAIIIMLVFIAASFASRILSYIKYGAYGSIFDNLLKIVSSALYPICYVLVPAVIILVMNKDKKKPLTTVISTLVICSVPVVANYVINLVEYLGGFVYYITSPIGTALSVLATVLSYFGEKALFEMDDDKEFIKKFVTIEVLAAFVLYVLSSMNII